MKVTRLLRTRRALYLLFILSLVLARPALRAAEGNPSRLPDTGGGGEKDEKGEPESHVKKGPHGETLITLDVATQKGMGLQTAPLAPAQLSPESKAYGRVADYSSLASLVADLTSARAASEASQAELTRQKTLAAQNNASQRSIETATANAARDQAQLEATRLKLVAGWGPALANRNDLANLVQALVTNAAAVVELDLAAGEQVPGQPTGARVLTLNFTNPIPAEFLGPVSVVDPQLQGRGFLFLVNSNGSRLIPGAAVNGFVSFPGEPQTGVTVPRDTVVRHEGATWVYLQTGPETFERREIKLAVPWEGGWFVSEGLKAGDKVVVLGAQQLLSEEMKGSLSE